MICLVFDQKLDQCKIKKSKKKNITSFGTNDYRSGAKIRLLPEMDVSASNETPKKTG